MASYGPSEEELIKDFIDKLYQILNTFQNASPPKNTMDQNTLAIRTGKFPFYPISDQDLIKAMLGKIMDYYIEWKSGPTPTTANDAYRVFTQKLGYSPIDIKNRENTKLIIGKLLDLSNKRVAELQIRLNKKIELFKSI